MIFMASVEPNGATTLSITTFSLTTLSIKGLYVTLGINDTHSITMLCHYAKCRDAQCQILFVILLNVIVLSVVILNVVAPSQTASDLPTLFSNLSIPVSGFNPMKK
jgi:hypothetical protein